MQGQDFLVQLLTKLDINSALKDYEQIKKRLASDPIIQKINIDTTLSKQAIKVLSAEIHKELTKAFKECGVEPIALSLKDVRSALSSTVKESAQLSTELNKAATNAQKFLNSLNAKSNGAIANLQEFKELERTIAGLGNTHSIKQLNSAMSALKTVIKNTYVEQARLTDIQSKINLGSYKATYDDLIAKTQQWTNANGNSTISVEKLTRAYKELGIANSALTKDSGNVAKQQALVKAEQELNTQVKSVTNSIKSMNAEFAKSSAIKKLNTDVKSFISKNGAAMRVFGKELNDILLKTANGAKISKQELGRLRQQLIDIGTSARESGNLGSTFFQTLAAGAKKFSYWTSSTFIIMKTIQTIRSAIGSVKDLDTELVDLQKTTDATSKELRNFYFSANDIAKQLGVATKEVIAQASAWSRLGYSIGDAKKMAGNSSIFASISPGMDIDKATSGLVSSMKAFKISADDSLDGVISKVNSVGNAFALSNEDIVESLTRSSAAMAAANNSLDETIALATSAIEITQDAASVGTALKTISMRIRGYDEETEQLSEDLSNLTGEIANLTKTTSAPGGLSLFTDDTKETYKSTYQILKEISGIWDELSDKNQANKKCLCA